jgi:hypothetical protein
MSMFKCNYSSDTGAALRSLRRGAGWAVKLGAVLVLAGCASTLPARVTTFQQWPADAPGASYKLTPTTEQQDSLEYRQYADMLRTAISPVGIVEARPGAQARFLITMTYGVEPVQVRVERQYDPFYSPWGPYGYGYGGFGGRRGGGFGFGVPFGGAPYPQTWSSTTMDASRASLKVEIRDAAQSNAKVYESTAVNTGAGGSLPEIMPYLVRAIFDRFPDTNGQVRQVNYEMENRR